MYDSWVGRIPSGRRPEKSFGELAGILFDAPKVVVYFAPETNKRSWNAPRLPLGLAEAA